MVVGEQASQKGTSHSPTAISHRFGCTSDCYCSSLIIDGRIEWMFRRFPAIGCLLNKLIPRLQVSHTPSLLPCHISLYVRVRCAGALYFFVLLKTCFHSTTPRTWQSASNPLLLSFRQYSLSAHCTILPQPRPPFVTTTRSPHFTSPSLLDFGTTTLPISPAIT